MPKVVSLRRIMALFGLSLLAVLPGCGGEWLSPNTLAARRELQFNRPQESLDKLSAEPLDDSASAHYLRALALERLDQVKAAKSEAQLAIDRATKNPKFRGLALRLKLFDGEDSAIEPLLQLHQEHPSSAGVSLDAVFAFQAKMVRLRTEGKLRSARVQLEKAEASLKTALSLAAELPERQRELIGMAIWFELPTEALKLIAELLKEEPGNHELLRDKVKVLEQTKQSAEAIRTAAELFRRLERTEASAVEFANTLNRLPASPAVFEQYDTLRQRFPKNTEILVRHCWSRGKAGQVEQACAELTSAFGQQTDARRKRLVAQSAIAIPLEVGDAKVAAQQFQRFRKEVSDPQLLAYMEGQLAFLRKDFSQTLDMMQVVVDAARKDSTASPMLAREAFRWIRRLLAQQTLTDQVRRAAELTLRRSGVGRVDDNELRDEARSLLQLLEADSRSESEPTSRRTPPTDDTGTKPADASRTRTSP